MRALFYFIGNTVFIYYYLCSNALNRSRRDETYIEPASTTLPSPNPPTITSCAPVCGSSVTAAGVALGDGDVVAATVDAVVMTGVFVSDVGVILVDGTGVEDGEYVGCGVGLGLAVQLQVADTVTVRVQLLLVVHLS